MCVDTISRRWDWNDPSLLIFSCDLVVFYHSGFHYLRSLRRRSKQVDALFVWRREAYRSGVRKGFISFSYMTEVGIRQSSKCEFSWSSFIFSLTKDYFSSAAANCRSIISAFLAGNISVSVGKNLNLRREARYC